MERRIARIDGRDVAWLDMGDGTGTPVVVLHGGGLDRAGASWGHALPMLAEQRRVIAPDLPGHGRSDLLSGTYRVADIGRWLATLLDALELKRVVLTGVSLGGAVALWTALEAPDRVAAVVPVASYGLARSAPFHPLAFLGSRAPLNKLIYPMIARSDLVARQAIATIVHDRHRITPDLVTEVRQIAATTRAAEAYDHFLQDEIRTDHLHTWLAPRLPDLIPPALFVHGLHDLPVPIGAARAAAVRAGARLVELDAGHWPMVEAPTQFNEALAAFFDELGT